MHACMHACMHVKCAPCQLGLPVYDVLAMHSLHASMLPSSNLPAATHAHVFGVMDDVTTAQGPSLSPPAATRAHGMEGA
jgi:hypothetical protein